MYSELSTTELLSLFRAVVQELNIRDVEAKLKAKNIFVEEIIKREDLEQLLEKAAGDAQAIIQDRMIQDRNYKIEQEWIKKKEQAEKLKQFPKLNEANLWISVWQSPSGEKRVYLNDGQPRERGTKEIAVYYLSGSSKFPAGTLEFHYPYNAAISDSALKNILHDIGSSWEKVTFSANRAIR